MSHLYWDCGATTPVRPEVLEAMLPFFSDHFANPGSLHASGLGTARTLEKAREVAAACIGARPAEIVFTAGGTEANNIALLGVMRKYARKGDTAIISAVEHDSVREVGRQLRTEGYEVAELPVNGDGEVDLEALRDMVCDTTVLVSVMHGNNEVGTLQPVREIGAMLQERKTKGKGKPFFHCDAVQSFGKIPVHVGALGVDLLTLSAHKIHGPKGTGLLYAHKDVLLAPVMHGGGQENGKRSGTHNVPGIVGMAQAMHLAEEERESTFQSLKERQEQLISGIMDMERATITGSRNRRLPHNVHFRIEGIEGQALMLELSRKGIDVSTGSACHASSQEPSHVMKAMGYTAAEADQGVRITLGRDTSPQDVDRGIRVLKTLVENFRSMEV